MLVAHAFKKRRLLEAEAAVEVYAGPVLTRDAGDEHLEAEAAAVGYEQAHKLRARASPLRVGMKVNGCLESTGVSGALLPQVGVAVAHYPALVHRHVIRELPRYVLHAAAHLLHGKRLRLEALHAVEDVPVVQLRDLRYVLCQYFAVFHK